jgi:hypothetical protein
MAPGNPTPQEFLEYLKDGREYAGAECWLTPFEQRLARFHKELEYPMYELAHYRVQWLLDHFGNKAAACGDFNHTVIDMVFDQCLYYKPTWMTNEVVAVIRGQLHAEYTQLALEGNQF